MKTIEPLLPFLAGWALLLASVNFRAFGALNGVLQALLFALVVCIPVWRTGRMAYVDIGWPWGLVVLGSLTLAMGQGDSTRVAMVGGLYLFIGGRMGVFALKLWRAGALQREFPRYEYQVLRWQRRGEQNLALARQVEVFAQGLANASYLALPAVIIAANGAPALSTIEFLGFGLACAALVFESVADVQKVAFLAKAKSSGQRNSVCDVGLWRYCRHPNYFGEWMVWNGLVVMALPSIVNLFEMESLVVASLMTFGLLFVSRLMYVTLVYHTGATPAEHYSVQKRPSYAAYQRTTNMFFPGPPRS